MKDEYPVDDGSEEEDNEEQCNLFMSILYLVGFVGMCILAWYAHGLAMKHET